MVHSMRIASLLSCSSFFKKPSTSPQMYVMTRGIASRTLFVGGLSYQVKEEDLRKAFAAHGELVEARVKFDHRTGISKCFGFVEYSSVEDAKNAMRLMNGQVLGGKHIRVAYSVSEPRISID